MKSHVCVGGCSFTRLNPHSHMHDRITETPFTHSPTILMSTPHAHLKARFPCRGRIFKHVYDSFTRESGSIHVPFSEYLHMHPYRSIYICKSDLSHLHMHKSIAYKLSITLLNSAACLCLHTCQLVPHTHCYTK